MNSEPSYTLHLKLGTHIGDYPTRIVTGRTELQENDGIARAWISRSVGILGYADARRMAPGAIGDNGGDDFAKWSRSLGLTFAMVSFVSKYSNL